jgi:mercuric ion transport protein
VSTSSVQKSEPVLSKRRLGLAGIAAFIGCAACCAVPLLAAAGLGSGAVASLSAVFRPGSELLVGGAVFVAALGVMAVRSRLKRSAASGCGSACKVDGACCDRGAAPRSA